MASTRRRSRTSESHEKQPMKRAKLKNKINYLDPCTRLLASPAVKPEENVGCGRSGIVRNFRNEVTLKLAVAVPPPVTLRDLLYNIHLERVVQFNFTVDLDFLMLNIHPQIRDSIPVTVIHGHRRPESLSTISMQASQWPNVNLIRPNLPHKFGTHHTKAMLLFSNDRGTKSVRLVVATANLCRDDWENMTQGIYLSPRCYVKTTPPVPGTITGAEYESPFERDLLTYLEAYGHSLRDVYDMVRKYDWSPCKAILIGSVPGYHRGENFAKWGLQRLKTVLHNHVKLSEVCCRKSVVVAQCSSVASFSQRWFENDFSPVMKCAENASKASRTDVKFIYPTVDDVKKSHTGIIDSSGFLRMDHAVYEKCRSWFDSYLCRWKSEAAGRQVLMPHIKTYTRIYGDEYKMIAWHLLTSANLSRAAWGEYQKDRTQLHIKSYELGVFLCPSLFQDSTYPDVYLMASTVPDPHPVPSESVSAAKDVTVVPVRLPYDVPVTSHEHPGSCYTRQYALDAVNDFIGKTSTEDTED